MSIGFSITRTFYFNDFGRGVWQYFRTCPARPHLQQITRDVSRRLWTSVITRQSLALRLSARPHFQLARWRVWSTSLETRFLLRGDCVMGLPTISSPGFFFQTWGRNVSEGQPLFLLYWRLPRIPRDPPSSPWSLKRRHEVLQKNNNLISCLLVGPPMPFGNASHARVSSHADYRGTISSFPPKAWYSSETSPNLLLSCLLNSCQF